MECEAGRGGADPEPANVVSLARARSGADTSRDRLLRSDPMPVPSVARDLLSGSNQLRRCPSPKTTVLISRATFLECEAGRGGRDRESCKRSLAFKSAWESGCFRRPSYEDPLPSRTVARTLDTFRPASAEVRERPLCRDHERLRWSVTKLLSLWGTGSRRERDR